MPRTTKYKPQELVAFGHALQKLLGRVPARSDIRGENKKKLKEVMGVNIPNEKAFSDAFGSWGAYLHACGWRGPDREIDKIERAAVDYCVSELGVTEETADRSITDGWYPDGRTVEIKGSVLRMMKDKEGREYPHFAFRLHKRQLSASADELILVGLSRDLEPILRIQIPNKAMAGVTDFRINAAVYANAVWGTGDSKFRRFIKWRKPSNSLEQAINDWCVGDRNR